MGLGAMTLLSKILLSLLIATYTVIYLRWVNDARKPKKGQRRMGLIIEFKKNKFVVLRSNEAFEDIDDSLKATEDFHKGVLKRYPGSNSKDGEYVEWWCKYAGRTYVVREPEGPG